MFNSLTLSLKYQCARSQVANARLSVLQKKNVSYNKYIKTQVVSYFETLLILNVLVVYILYTVFVFVHVIGNTRTNTKIFKI